LLEWQNTAAEEAIASPKNILKKIKEGVDIGIRSYKFIRPDSDLGQRVGNVLRRSASSTRTSTRWCRHPKMSLRQATATWVDSPLPQPPETIFDSAGPVSHKQ
jgi:hypothetical protein